MRLHNPKSTVPTGLVLNLLTGASICALQTPKPLLKLNIETRADLQAVQVHVKQLESRFIVFNNQERLNTI